MSLYEKSERFLWKGELEGGRERKKKSRRGRVELAGGEAVERRARRGFDEKRDGEEVPPEGGMKGIIGYTKIRISKQYFSVNF